MQLRDLLQKPNAIIIDVRERWEFLFGHIDGSFNIPLGEVAGRVNEFLEMEGPILLVCASGNRSGMAAQFLASRGVKEVYNAGGWHQVQQIKKALKRA